MTQPAPGVLVVEDNPANLLLVEAVLRRAGYRVLSATTADRAHLPPSSASIGTVTSRGAERCAGCGLFGCRCGAQDGAGEVLPRPG